MLCEWCGLPRAQCGPYQVSGKRWALVCGVCKVRHTPGFVVRFTNVAESVEHLTIKVTKAEEGMS